MTKNTEAAELRAQVAQLEHIVVAQTVTITEARVEVARLREACEKAIEWLEGWASAEPYLTAIRAALTQQEQV